MKKLTDHRNFKYIENLNNDIESYTPFLIDHVIDDCNYENELILLDRDIEYNINFDIIDAQNLVGSRRFSTFFYKGKLYIHKSEYFELLEIKNSNQWKN